MSSEYRPISSASRSEYRPHPSAKELIAASRRSAGRPARSWEMLTWKWWPGTASWNAVASLTVRSRSVAWWVLT
jgi:hypothetical protein